MARTDITVPLTVSLRPGTMEKFEEAAKGTPIAEYLANRTKLILENIGDGGMVLTADQVEAVEAVTKKAVRNGKDIVAAAQRTVGIEDGQHVIRLTVDPMFMDAIKIRAQEAGRTVNELFSDMGDIAFENNWIFGIDPVGKRRTFSAEQEEFFAKFTGKSDFELRDIVESLEKCLQEA